MIKKINRYRYLLTFILVIILVVLAIGAYLYLKKEEEKITIYYSESRIAYLNQLGMHLQH